jgi:hypothetical protein
MAHHQDLLNNKSIDGGAFDMAAESGTTPGQLKKRKPNSWKDSATLNMSDISDNMMIHNKGALNDYTDAQRNAAIQSAIQIGKKKKKGKGGIMGGLGSFLGPLSTIASFAFPQFAMPLKMLSAVSSFANGNPLGGLASMVGASGLGGSLAGSIGNSINGALSTTSALSGMGGMIGNGLVGAGLGALGGASSGNAGYGALSGGLSSGLGSYLSSPSDIGGTGLSQGVTKAITGGLGAAGNYAYQQAKQKQAMKATLSKMKTVR